MAIIPPADLGLHADSANLDARAANLLAYWRAKAGAATMPRRQDMSVDELAVHLPNLAFVDRVADPVNFRFRLVGSEIVKRSLADRTGHWFSDVPAMAYGTKFWRRYDWVACYHQPLFSEVDYVGADEGVRLCQDLILPLAGAEGGAVSLMTLVTYIRMGQRA